MSVRRADRCVQMVPQNRWRTHGDHCYFPEAVRENEEVVPVNVSTWVLPSGVTVGR